MRRRYVIEAICNSLIFLFVYTAISKLYELQKFQSVISKLPLIGDKAPFFAWGLPLIELIISLTLIISSLRLWGLYGSFIVMLFLTIYLAYMVAFIPQLPCSCGGVIEQMTWKQHVMFNLFFVLLSLTGIQLQKQEYKSQGHSIHQLI